MGRPGGETPARHGARGLTTYRRELVVDHAPTRTVASPERARSLRAVRGATTVARDDPADVLTA
ncbi:MAG: hypothetical protein ACREND_06520, partial [Gemmatimonadaceae bacterium]